MFFFACASTSNRLRVDLHKVHEMNSKKYRYRLVFKEGRDVIMERHFRDGKLVQSSGRMPDTLSNVVLYKTTEFQNTDFFEDSLFMEKEAIYTYEDKEIARRTFTKKGNELLTDLTGEIPDGLVLRIEENGMLVGYFSYKNNSRNGLEVEFYPNGNIRLITSYKDDHPESGRIFYAGGNLQYEWKLVGGVSQHIGYYENGNIKEKVTYENGKFIMKEYDENGKLIEAEN
jgi:antitoxin component YwqK of YwqJK toxin-antitoxin module